MLFFFKVFRAAASVLLMHPPLSKVANFLEQLELDICAIVQYSKEKVKKRKETKVFDQNKENSKNPP